MVDIQLKTCSVCKEEKHHSLFTTNRSNYKCRKCFNEYRRSYRKRPEVRERDKITHTKSFLIRTYGISVEMYNQILKEQNGLCAICETKSNKVNRISQKQDRLSIDHCHNTNRVRGILCSKCNPALGLFMDNEEILIKAIAYLRKHKV